MDSHRQNLKILHYRNAMLPYCIRNMNYLFLKVYINSLIGTLLLKCLPLLLSAYFHKFHISLYILFLILSRPAFLYLFQNTTVKNKSPCNMYLIVTVLYM